MAAAATAAVVVAAAEETAGKNQSHLTDNREAPAIAGAFVYLVCLDPVWAPPCPAVDAMPGATTLLLLLVQGHRPHRRRKLVRLQVDRLFLVNLPPV